jgi:menaquinone-dependent protoporphyrinogen oxidase
MTKAMIVYGTRYGATANTSEIIADILRQENFEVKIVDAKKEKVPSLNDFDLILVGIGIQMANGQATRSPSKSAKGISAKGLALFVSCGGANPLSEGEQKIRNG